MARSTAYDRVRVQGRVLDKMTAQAFGKADAKMRRDTGKSLILVQGSYNVGGVAASAGTHDGGGAADVSIRNLTAAQVVHAIKSLRFHGFTAEHRYAPPFSGPHIHGIQIGNARVSSGAAYQVREYLAGRSGLASRGRGTVMGYRPKKPYRYVEPKPVATKRTIVRPLAGTRRYVVTSPVLSSRKVPSPAGGKNLVTKRHRGFTFTGRAIATDPASGRTYIRATTRWYDAAHLDLIVKD